MNRIYSKKERSKGMMHKLATTARKVQCLRRSRKDLFMDH
jgi:hypothetical protein